jgi:hypothetical protein
VGLITNAEVGCKGINAMLHLNQLTYTVQPMPVLSGVDLAALFLHRESLARSNLLFGTSCASCEQSTSSELITW